MVESGDINMLRRVADRIAPEAGELTAMIAVAAAIEMTNVINGMGRGL